MNRPSKPSQSRARILTMLAGSLALPLSLWGQATATPPAGTSSTQPEGETIILSPFQVDASQDIGYYAENTLAGSRLRTNVADLAASITVVTKQQMVDTGSLDLNDVFLYEANTEGTGNWTEMTIDSRGAFQDRTAGFQGGAPALPSGPSTANRVRGIGNVDKSRDYYPSIQRLQFDVYNTDSIEINRGPNALLFGLGSPAGIVNQSAAKANVTRARGQIEGRVDSYGGYRGSFLYNQPILEDRLAVLVAGLHDSRGFERDPSYDVTRRLYLATTFKPFEKTTLRANFEDMHNRNRRPNSVTPRDFVTPWIEAGRPMYNPLTRTLTVNGVTTGPYDGSVVASMNALMAASGNTIQFDGNNRPLLTISQGNELGYIMRHIPSAPATAGVQAQFAYNTPFRLTKSQGPFTQANIAPAGTQAGIQFQDPGVHDRSIYDWEKINMISGNFGTEGAEVYNLELEQEILPNLHLQLGWYREDYQQDLSWFISQQTGVTLYVDTNTHLLDGTVNPHAGRPFIEITQPDRFQHPEENETLRGTLAYTLDFSRNDGWSRWIGRHNLIGLVQRTKTDRLNLRYRPYISGNTQLWNPIPLAGGNPDIWAGNTTQNAIERRFYVGGTNSLVTMDPGLYPNGTRGHSLRWFNRTLPGTDANTGLNGQWVNENIVVDEALHFVSRREGQEVKSRAIAWQSYFWDDRIIGTLGWRRDESDAFTGAFLGRLPNGFTDPAGLDIPGATQSVAGNTRTIGIVVKPLSWLSLHYNESDNFQPAGINTDFYGRPLPFPEGNGEDWGFGLTLLENKLYANINWFEASQDNARGAFIGQIVSRTAFLDDSAFRNWAAAATGTNPNSPEVQALMQLPSEAQAAWPTQGTIPPMTTTQSVAGEGMEISVIYNPMPNWNMKLAVGRQETVFTNVAPEWLEWVAQRRTVWEQATVPSAPANIRSFWSTLGGNYPGGPVVIGANETAQQFFESAIAAPASVALANQGRATPAQREWRAALISNYNFTDGALRDFGIGGAFRWEDKAAIGYLGIQDQDGIYRRIDVDSPVYGDSEMHFDFWASYRFHSLPFIGDRARMKLQLNIRDAFESGVLERIAANPVGDAVAWRIVDPRQFILTATFDF